MADPQGCGFNSCVALELEFFGCWFQVMRMATIVSDLILAIFANPFRFLTLRKKSGRDGITVCEQALRSFRTGVLPISDNFVPRVFH